ncbi:MAG TPA: hypothetical protein VI454_15300 [Verrucomicrobiae bacterium]|jgi:hypothetical protein
MDIESLQKHAEIHAEAVYKFADRVSTLSTGALALSITFRKDIIGPAPSSIWLLHLSWVAFVIAVICCTVYGFSKAKVHWEIASSIAAGHSFGVATPGLFFSSCFKLGYGFFLIGVVALVWFAILNT